MGAQVETTQQYSSTFIVLPAQWKLALRWARLILKKTVDHTADCSGCEMVLLGVFLSFKMK